MTDSRGSEPKSVEGKLKALNQARTKGPWVYNMSSGFPRVTVPCHKGPQGIDAFEVDTCDGKACRTAEFIALAANSMSKLLDCVDLLKTLVNEGAIFDGDMEKARDVLRALSQEAE